MVALVKSAGLGHHQGFARFVRKLIVTNSKKSIFHESTGVNVLDEGGHGFHLDAIIISAVDIILVLGEEKGSKPVLVPSGYICRAADPNRCTA